MKSLFLYQKILQRKFTGHEAISQVNYFIKNSKYKELIYQIFIYSPIEFPSQFPILKTNLLSLRKNLINIKNQNLVFDGELFIVDEQGKEDFREIVSIIRKKNYEIKTAKYIYFIY